eukprot:TRINITY_DN342_c0_g1_i1.p1 TRINITY_DN342_c0_g1~~TRINITY_DN342_c0_g1_i1.p1  ORF type:complete len:499 (-),score=76.96 TRINITY_DN342_c0_g1_i1:47-1543(-)
MKIERVLALLFVLCGLCWSVGAVTEPNWVECQACQFFMNVAEGELKDNASMTDLALFLTGFCNDTILYKTECTKLALSLTALLASIPKEAARGFPFSYHALCSMVGFCTVDCCATPNLPEQIHLSLTKDPSQMVITWVTSTSITTSYAYYSLQGSTPSTSILAKTYTYTTAGWLGNIHTATLPKLLPFTSYSYRVGSFNGGWSQTFNFTTRGNVSTNSPLTFPISFGVVADLGTVSAGANETIDNLIREVSHSKWNGIIHAGDISYADGYQGRWDEFLRKVQPMTTSIPYITAPGNHELAFEFSSYRHRFNNPIPCNSCMYYSFDWSSSLHVLMIDTESELDVPEMTSAQVNWIAADLNEVANRKGERPFIVVFGHRPFYCSKCTQWEAEYLRGRLENLFLKYNVDLVVVGHVHYYERTSKVWNNEIGLGPMYVVNGAAGNREGLNSFGEPPYPEWSLVRVRKNSYGELTIHNSTHMEWKMKLDPTGEIADQVWITKN